MKKVCIIGLGYVGLPLAVEFGKKRPVIGFDISTERINKLNSGFDETMELTRDEIDSSKNLVFTSNEKDIANSQIYIITVPTPIDSDNVPDLRPLQKASELVGRYLKKGDIVIYESTVYPGATEEFCVPILEEYSNYKYNKDFYCGYSPERINPGDKEHTLINIKKVTSGSTIKVAKEVDQLYSEIIKAGTHLASSIIVAESAKVIENTQRDLNIALINELSIIFNKLGVDTTSVLEAAATKWNFLNFKPGLVGGHCIGVDPYYLTYKAQQIGIHPKLILAGRDTNDFMPKYVSERVITIAKKKKIILEDSRALILGITFKENCPDTRNSKVVDLVKELISKKINVDVFDPWADKTATYNNYGIELIENLELNKYQILILAVPHNNFMKFSKDYIKQLCDKNCVIYDIKSILDPSIIDERL